MKACTDLELLSELVPCGELMLESLCSGLELGCGVREGGPLSGVGCPAENLERRNRDAKKGHALMSSTRSFSSRRILFRSWTRAVFSVSSLSSATKYGTCEGGSQSVGRDLCSPGFARGRGASERRRRQLTCSNVSEPPVET